MARLWKVKPGSWIGSSCFDFVSNIFLVRYGEIIYNMFFFSYSVFSSTVCILFGVCFPCDVVAVGCGALLEGFFT